MWHDATAPTAMTAHLTIAMVACCAAALTLYSGFGLGTLLLPAFALFFPVEIAVFATALVHGANNVFKVALVGRFAHRDTVLRFGIPAVLAAIAGAWLLGRFAGLEPLAEYRLAGREAVVTPVKLVLGLLMLAFAVFELAPRLREFRFHKRHLVAGGLLSGFFGGLSGHQGALRSAFLAKSLPDAPTFVGTSAVIGLLVDLVRLVTYTVLLLAAGMALTWPREAGSLVLTGCLAAFAGVLLGTRFLHQVTIGVVQAVTGVLLTLVALGLVTGLL